MSKKYYDNLAKIVFVWGVLSSFVWGNFYIGVEGGYLRSKSIYIFEDKSGKVTTDQQPSWSKNIIGNGGVVNLTLGTEHFFANGYVGLRWGIFGGYGLTQSKGHIGDLGNVDVNLSTLSAGANLDILVNFYVQEHLTTGLFIGAEYDFTLLRPDRVVEIGEKKASTAPKEDMMVGNKTHSSNAVVRVGLSTLIARHHRIELFTKIPVWTQKHSEHFILPDQYALPNKQKDDRKYTFKYEYLQALLSYKYVF